MRDVDMRFGEALGQIRSASSAAAVWANVKDFAAQLGYTHLVGVDAAPPAYTDAPMIAAEIDRTYDYASAPFVQRALRSPETFLLSELRAQAPDQAWAHLMVDVIKRGDGLVVPVYDGEDPLAGFVFGGETPNTSALSRAMLQVLAHTAFDRYRALLTDKSRSAPNALSVREIQCLRAVATGKTDAEVGETLGISPRTVRFHIDGAKAKLQAKSRVQAIAKALQDRIIVV
jgi:DNA-binding CsgD family transcriptional regulator